MYQHGKRTAKAKNPKVFLYMAFVLGLSLVVVAFILHKDLSTDTKERTTVPIITEVEEQRDEVITIDEKLFSLELPKDWIETNRVSTHYANFFEWHSTKPGGDDRRLLLHIDIMPASYKIVRMLPLSVSGNRFDRGSLSDECTKFATSAASQGSNAPAEATWENVSFVCDPIEANQTVGTGTAEYGIGARVGNHTFFFYYEDHNIRPDYGILERIVESFRAK